MLHISDDEMTYVIICFGCYSWSHWRLREPDRIGTEECLAKGTLTAEWIRTIEWSKKRPWWVKLTTKQREVEQDLADRAAIHRVS